MVEKNFDFVIGIVFDGVGYGIDGNIWGGEVFYLGYEDVERLVILIIIFFWVGIW